MQVIFSRCSNPGYVTCMFWYRQGSCTGGPIFQCSRPPMKYPSGHSLRICSKQGNENKILEKVDMANFRLGCIFNKLPQFKTSFCSDSCHYINPYRILVALFIINRCRIIIFWFSVNINPMIDFIARFFEITFVLSNYLPSNIFPVYFVYFMFYIYIRVQNIRNKNSLCFFIASKCGKTLLADSWMWLFGTFRMLQFNIWPFIYNIIVISISFGVSHRGISS